MSELDEQEKVGVFPATFSIQRNPLSPSDSDDQNELLGPAEWILEAIGREFKHLGIVQIKTDSYRDAVGMLFAKATSTLLALGACRRKNPLRLVTLYPHRHRCAV